jgi:signal peptidase I
MLPTLTPGDYLAVRSLRPTEPRLGQIVVVNDTERETVKRVVRGPTRDETGFWVEGDNRAASTDSRTLGPVARARIVGVVRARYRPLRRARVFR